jgi:hypothetical protein
MVIEVLRRSRPAYWRIQVERVGRLSVMARARPLRSYTGAEAPELAAAGAAFRPPYRSVGAGESREWVVLNRKHNPRFAHAVMRARPRHWTAALARVGALE